MAEKPNTGTIDIAKLLADAKAQAAANKAAKTVADAAAKKARTSKEIEDRVKFMAKSASDRANGLETIIQEDFTVITRISKDITDNGGTISTSNQRDLKFYVDRYNKSITEQQRLLKESTDLSNNKYNVDNQGKLTLKKPASETPPSAGTPAGTPAATPTAQVGPDGKPVKAAAADTKITNPVVKDNGQGDKVVQNQGSGAKYSGKGTAENPFTKDGKAFSGTYGGKTYAKGVVSTEPKGGLSTEQELTLGTYGSKYLLEYFKTKYPDIYIKLIEFAKANESPANVEGYLKNQSWYKDVNQRKFAQIGGYELANGIELTDAKRTEYRDQLLSKVKDATEIQYEIRIASIDKFALDTTKPEIARTMRAGLDFEEAAKDYIDTYVKNFDLATSQFSVSDKVFQQILISSKNIGDFEKQIRRTDKYISQPQIQQKINSNKIVVQTKYREFGLTLTAEAAANLGKNLFLGDTSNEQIDENLRQEAIKLFPAFRDRILNGESPLSIASPYIGAMSRILEIPEGGLDIEDATVRKAMQGKVITKGDQTTYETVPLWQFEQDLYKDSRWQYTANARGKADSISIGIGQMLGLTG